MNKQCKCCKKRDIYLNPIYEPLKQTKEPQEPVIDYYLCEECYNTSYGMH